MRRERRARGSDGASSSSSTVSRWSWPVNQTSPRLPEPTTAIVDSSAGGGISSWSRSTTPSVVWLGERRAGDGRADALAAGDLRQHRVDERRPLARGLRLDERGPPAHEVADDLAEALAVALLERRAEALAVVGEDHELVRARRVLGGLGQGADRLVDAVERLERLDPLGAAVVGELVVVGEVRVDDVRAAIHLLDDQRDVHVAQQDVARGAHARRTSCRDASAAGCPDRTGPARLDAAP